MHLTYLLPLSRKGQLEIRLAAPAERRGGFGTCAQSGRQGDQRTLPYPRLPAHRLLARPDPARRTYISERGARAQSSEPTSPGRNSLRGTPAWTRPRSDPRVRTRIALSTDSDRPTPDYLALSLMPQPHDAMGAGVGWQALRSVWIPTGPALRTTRRGHHPWNCLNRCTRLIDTGWRLPPFVGCFQSTPTVLDPEQRLGRAQDPSDATSQRRAALRTARP